MGLTLLLEFTLLDLRVNKATQNIGLISNQYTSALDMQPQKRSGKTINTCLPCTFSIQRKCTIGYTFTQNIIPGILMGIIILHSLKKKLLKLPVSPVAMMYAPISR